MLFHVPNVLKPEQVAQARQILEQAPWVDGRTSSGAQASQVKNNKEVPRDHQTAKEVGAMILAGLGQSKVFSMAALPLKVSPPSFNSYEGGQTYGAHIDNAVRALPEGAGLIRGDLSATLFISEPGDYDGGELTVEDTFGVHSSKLPAGHLVLYPASSLHYVKPVTRGKRIAAFFWIQSMVRRDDQRTLLLDMELAVQKLIQDHPNHPSLVQLTGVYNNLLRSWAEV
jgi:PKHD-type hydroxylase